MLFQEEKAESQCWKMNALTFPPFLFSSCARDWTNGVLQLWALFKFKINLSSRKDFLGMSCLVECVRGQKEWRLLNHQILSHFTTVFSRKTSPGGASVHQQHQVLIFIPPSNNNKLPVDFCDMNDVNLSETRQGSRTQSPLDHNFLFRSDSAEITKIFYIN